MKPRQLGRGEIHVIAVPLSVEFHQEALELLDDEERRRAERLRSPETSRRYVVMHVALRQTLAIYTGFPPTSIRFSIGPYGKPALAEPAEEIAFSLSHSADEGVIALCRSEIGVDIERVDPAMDFFPVAKRYFSPQEFSTLISLPEHLRREAFYRCWTRKEAYLKGCGAGFILPSDKFAVSLAPDEPPALVQHQLQHDETDRWHLVDMPSPPGFAAAIATTENPRHISYFTHIFAPLTLPEEMMTKL